MRWDHPDHGILLPAQFIELAEDNGRILAIGKVVLEQACLQAKGWLHAFGSALQVSVNLSARQFRQAGLQEEVAAALRRHRHGAFAAVPRDQGEPGHGRRGDDLDHLDRGSTPSASGWAIDDFGTGHSSLGYLARFPIDVVKVDQSFVRDVEQDPVKSAIVSAVVALSARPSVRRRWSRGWRRRRELEEILGLGCDVAQGYYFSRTVDGRCVRQAADGAGQAGDAGRRHRGSWGPAPGSRGGPAPERRPARAAD